MRCVSGKGKLSPLIRRLRLYSLLLLGLLLGNPSYAEDERWGLSVDTAKIWVDEAEGVLLLDADLDLQLSTKVIDALAHGVDLQLRLKVDVTGQRAWWFDKKLARTVRGYNLSYQSLLDSYQLLQRDGMVTSNHVSLTDALQSISQVRSLVIAEDFLLPEKAPYCVKIRVILDKSPLPLPLRPGILFSSQWDLTRPWYQCSR